MRIQVEKGKRVIPFKRIFRCINSAWWKKIIDTVVNEASVPVIETGAGNCHIFIDESAKPDMAIQIAINGKTQRPSVCNAIESILIHENWFKQYGTQLL